MDTPWVRLHSLGTGVGWGGGRALILGHTHKAAPPAHPARGQLGSWLSPSQASPPPRCAQTGHLPAALSDRKPGPGEQESRAIAATSFFLFFFFLGQHPRHLEVPRLGVEWGMWPPAYTTATATWDPSWVCDLHHNSRQRQILSPLSEAKERTRVLMDASRVR